MCKLIATCVYIILQECYCNICTVVQNSYSYNFGFTFVVLHASMKPIFRNAAPWIGFESTIYDFSEGTGIATLQILTNNPERFTNASGALLYTTDGTATSNGGIVIHEINRAVGLLLQKKYQLIGISNSFTFQYSFV